MELIPILAKLDVTHLLALTLALLASSLAFPSVRRFISSRVKQAAVIKDDHPAQHRAIYRYADMTARAAAAGAIAPLETRVSALERRGERTEIVMDNLLRESSETRAHVQHLGEGLGELREKQDQVLEGQTKAAVSLALITGRLQGSGALDKKES